MFLLNVKAIRFVIPCFVFFACFTTTFAQQEDALPVLPQNAADAENDFNMILLGMENYDGAALSGEGECLYVFRQPGTPEAYSTWKARLAFDPWHTRIEFEEGFSNNTQTPRATLLSSPSGTLEITYAKAEEPSYHFRRSLQAENLLLKSRRNLQVSENLQLKSQTEIELGASRDWVDPRRWLHSIDGRDLPTYLKAQNFRILKSEFFNGFPCYVLEAKQENGFERIWVSPELGLRYLQYENRFLSATVSADGQIKKGTPSVRRIRLSYGLYGEDAWFVTNGIAETLWIDADGEEYLINRAIIETQNFIVNHEIPTAVFAVDIPGDATIQVEALDKKLSEAEFRQWYDEIHLEGIRLIKDR
ncbi:hypothetical protein C6503_25230 [Candidatus Poribacteria bacterium]|nr:MAG: hypothetical protein C6503_25230 [Candidatus Poribacteria bacterium]